MTTTLRPPQTSEGARAGEGGAVSAWDAARAGDVPRTRGCASLSGPGRSRLPARAPRSCARRIAQRVIDPTQAARRALRGRIAVAEARARPRVDREQSPLRFH